MVIQRTVSVVPTWKEIAEEVAIQDCAYQSSFLRYIMEISRGWKDADAQWLNIGRRLKEDNLDEALAVKHMLEWIILGMEEA